MIIEHIVEINVRSCTQRILQFNIYTSACVDQSCTVAHVPIQLTVRQIQVHGRQP